MQESEQVHIRSLICPPRKVRTGPQVKHLSGIPDGDKIYDRLPETAQPAVQSLHLLSYMDSTAGLHANLSFIDVQ